MQGSEDEREEMAKWRWREADRNSYLVTANAEITSPGTDGNRNLAQIVVAVFRGAPWVLSKFAATLSHGRRLTVVHVRY